MAKNNKQAANQDGNSTKKATKKKKKVKVSHIVKPENMTLEEWQIKLRKQVTDIEHFNISCVDDALCPGEYIVRNPEKNNEYKVVYRGANSEWNYCSCMDFKTSRLGTCKHIEAVKKWFGGKRGVHVHRELPPYTSVYLSYRDERCVKIRIGSDNKEAYEQLAKDYFDKNHVLKKSAYARIGSFLKQARQISDTFRCYKDAIDFIIDIREKAKRMKIVKTYDDEKLNNLLKVNLYPYQKEGIRFAAKAGKAIIADEMGLGKTIQAIGTAELLRKEGLIGSVLILCPTSLKYQWRSEIKKFTDAEVFVIEGSHLKRKEAYNRPEPYKIISYNSAANDIKILGCLQTDMLIMDEVQRLKNWNTQISRAARKIESDYSVILSGTPLENKLDELYSIVEFVDNFRLAPYYLFKDKHIITDETGKVLGYKNLNDIGKKLGDILIRRRKKDVKLQMPERSDKNLFIPMTNEQMEMHQEWQNQVRLLILKWRRMHFLSDKDRKRLLLFLSQMRMVCDSSYILDQKTRYDTKVDECVNIISDIISEEGEKVVVFSQWERMTRLIAKELEKSGNTSPMVEADLAVGLPPEHYALRQRFADYFKRGRVNFVYNGAPICLLIRHVFVYPQAYAAVVPQAGRLKEIPRTFIIDIGGYTTDVMLLRNAAPDLQFCRSLEMGVIPMSNDIISRVSAMYDIKIDDDHIADIIQGRPTILPQEVRDVIFTKVRSYACDILDKLRELQVDLRANPAIFIGGGSILFRSFVEESPLVAHADFVTDPKANAIGYGMLATAQLRRMAPQNHGGEFFAQG